MKKLFNFFPIQMLIALGVSTTAWAYVVQEGDTLSQIAQKYISPSVYGKNGSLEKLLALNPQIKNANFIKTKQTLIMDEKIPFERKVGSEEISISPLENLITNERRGSFVLNPFYGLGSITSTEKSTGSESTIATQYNTGVNGSYVQEWSPEFQTALNLKLGMTGFEKPVSSTKTMQDKSKFVSSIGVETQHILNEKNRLNLRLDYGKELFVRAATTQSIAVDAINVASLGVKTSRDLKNLNPFILGVAASYRVKMPAKSDSYTIKLGHEIGASVYLTQQGQSADKSKFQTELGFTHRKQDTSITKQSETNVMLGVRFYFSSGI